MTNREKADFEAFWDTWAEIGDYAATITQGCEGDRDKLLLKNAMMISAYAAYLYTQRNSKKCKNKKETKK